MTERHAAVLLAAGGSRRLGHPKALLRRDGESLLRRGARLLLATRPRQLLVVLGDAAPRLTRELDGLGLATVLNPDWASGLASSLRYGLAALPCAADRMLLCGVDQPALASRHLDSLLALADTASSGNAVTRIANGPASPAVIQLDWLRRAGLPEGDRGLRERLSALPASSLGWLDAPELALDLDTEADVAAARAAGWLDAAG